MLESKEALLKQGHLDISGDQLRHPSDLFLI